MSLRRRLTRGSGLLLIAIGLSGAPHAQGPADDAALREASAGRVIALGTASGRFTARVPLEVYVARVLAGEAEPNAPAAALEAHAIAIRSFALANLSRHRHEGFDLCDSTHCQVLRTPTAAVREAARATAGRVLTYNGRLVEVVYSASCGGQSEDASALWAGRPVPYLTSRLDDVHDGDVAWTLPLSYDAVHRALTRHGFTGRRLTGLRVVARTGSGRVAMLALEGLAPATIAGAQFRTLMGPTVVRSTAFTVEDRPEGVLLTGRGYGHGVGMCVIGAGRRARRGEDAGAILAFYYPGLAQTDVRMPPHSGLPPVQPGGSAVSGPVPPAAGMSMGPAPGPLRVVVHPGGVLGAQPFEALVRDAYDQLTARLGGARGPVSVTLHASMASYRAGTGRPWWESTARQDGAIDVAPAAVLEQRAGVRFAVAQALAGWFVAEALAGRPAWARVGAARYFARAVAGDSLSQPLDNVRPRACPTDRDLEASVSAPAFRQAEERAEACFAAALARAGDWRTVR